MPQTESRDSLDLVGLARQLRRRLGLIVACVVALTMIAVALSVAQEKQYSSSSSLLFRDPAFDQKLFGSTFLAPNQDPDREAATNAELVSLGEVARRAAAALGTGLNEEDVLERVEVSPEGQSNVVSILATDRSPAFAARIANTLAEEYVSFRKAADRAKIQEAQALIERQIKNLAPRDRTGAKGVSLNQRADELRVLASLQTGNAEVVERATAPRSPSSPRPLRNGVLAAFLGLGLGLALAFLIERLDHRIRDPREIETLFDRPVLGSIPSSKALEKSITKIAPSSAEAESFRLLRANLRYFNVDRSVRSVLVTSAAPGDGKSTIAWNLAVAAAEAGVRTLVIEADLRHPGMPRTFETQSAGLTSVLAGEMQLDEAVQEVPLPDGHNGSSRERVLHALFSGPLPPNPTDLVESERMRDLLTLSEDSYDFVVVDTPPTSVVSDAIPLVAQVGGVLVVARLGKTTRGSLTQLQRQLVNLDAPVLGVVVNAVSRADYGYGYDYGYGDSYGSNRKDEPAVKASRV